MGRIKPRLRGHVNVRITGVNKTSLLLNLKRFGIKNASEDGLKKSGEFISKEIKQSIQGNRAESRSVDTGEFLKSIDLNVSKDRAIISSDVPQSVFMEFGTSRIPERRHFRNSLDRNKGKIIGIIKTEIQTKL